MYIYFLNPDGVARSARIVKTMTTRVTVTLKVRVMRIAEVMSIVPVQSRIGRYFYPVVLLSHPVSGNSFCQTSSGNFIFHGTCKYALVPKRVDPRVIIATNEIVVLVLRSDFGLHRTLVVPHVSRTCRLRLGVCGMIIFH